MNIYKMSEQELRAYAHEMGLCGGSVETLIHRVLHGRSWTMIADITKYSYRGIRHHRKQIMSKLGMEKL